MWALCKYFNNPNLTVGDLELADANWKDVEKVRRMNYSGKRLILMVEDEDQRTPFTRHKKIIYDTSVQPFIKFRVSDVDEFGGKVEVKSDDRYGTLLAKFAISQYSPNDISYSREDESGNRLYNFGHEWNIENKYHPLHIIFKARYDKDNEVNGWDVQLSSGHQPIDMFISENKRMGFHLKHAFRKSKHRPLRPEDLTFLVRETSGVIFKPEYFIGISDRYQSTLEKTLLKVINESPLKLQLYKR